MGGCHRATTDVCHGLVRRSSRVGGLPDKVCSLAPLPSGRGLVAGLLGASFMGFLIFEKGAEHLQQKRWKPLLLGTLIFIIATLPFAKPCALMVRFAMVKGVAALAQPKIALLVVLLLLVFACKCRAVFNLWRLVRASSEPRETRRIVISG